MVLSRIHFGVCLAFGFTDSTDASDEQLVGAKEVKPPVFVLPQRFSF